MKSVSDSNFFCVIRCWGVSMILLFLIGLAPAGLSADESLGAEATLRLIVEANAARDLATMSNYMSHDADAVGYTIDGHKYVGWPLLEAEMQAEFQAVQKLELPITYLQVWQKGDVAWFAMELDYIRYFKAEDPSQRMVLPLRETGVLERRDGRWILVAWHESDRQPDTGLGSALAAPTTGNHRPDASHADRSDVRGEWDITEDVTRIDRGAHSLQCEDRRVFVPVHAGRQCQDGTRFRTVNHADRDRGALVTAARRHRQ